MIMHPTRWRHDRLAAACGAALAVARPPRDGEPLADGITVTWVALATGAAGALGMVAVKVPGRPGARHVRQGQTST